MKIIFCREISIGTINTKALGVVEKNGVAGKKKCRLNPYPANVENLVSS